MVQEKWVRAKGNGIFLSDTPKEIRKKVMRAVTDEGPKTPDSEPCEPVKNLFTIMDVVSDPETVKVFQRKTCFMRDQVR